MYKKMKRGKLTDIDATEGQQQFNYVNADLQEIKDRGTWRQTFQTVLLYFEKCWTEIDGLKMSEKEYDRLCKNKKDTVQVPIHMTNREKEERHVWTIKCTNNTYTTDELSKYLEGLWGEIDSLRKFKYRIEYLKNHNVVSRFFGWKSQKLPDLLSELQELSLL